VELDGKVGVYTHPATDYKKKLYNITSGDKLNRHLAPDGGSAATIEKVK